MHADMQALMLSTRKLAGTALTHHASVMCVESVD